MKNLSDPQVENFLNNYIMRITEELVSTQILHSISIQKFKKRLNSKWKYRTSLFDIRSLLFEYSNIIHFLKKDRKWIRISLFGLLLFEYSNNELFVATLYWNRLWTWTELDLGIIYALSGPFPNNCTPLQSSNLMLPMGKMILSTVCGI